MERGGTVFDGDSISIFGGRDIENIFEDFDMVCDDGYERFGTNWVI